MTAGCSLLGLSWGVFLCLQLQCHWAGGITHETPSRMRMSWMYGPSCTALPRLAGHSAAYCNTLLLPGSIMVHVYHWC